MKINKNTITQELEEIALKVQLKEGINGVKRFLAVLARFPEKPIKYIAQKSGFPTPISVAIKNELIKKGWCEKKPKGNRLSSKGMEILNKLTQINFDLSCVECDGLGFKFDKSKFKEKIERFQRYSLMRGKPNTLIDQSFATDETNFKRVLFLNHNYDLIKDNYAFIGDSDLTSLVLAQFLNDEQEIVVFDIDRRIETIIQTYNSENKKRIKFVNHDFRKPISKEYRGKFDVILTDPPYTRQGVSLFVSRALELVNDQNGGVIYLSFGQKPPQEMLKIQQDLVKMNCLLTHILPRFNKYIGAQILAGESVLFRLEALLPLHPLIKGTYDGPLYTGDVNPKKREYVCLHCQKHIIVGNNEYFKTIEELKESGCPNCKNNRFALKKRK